jgi:hypothetical protein
MTHAAPTLAQDAISPPDPASDTPTPHDALRQALAKSGFHYTNFARYTLGVSPSSVWRWMQGQAIPQTVQDRVHFYLTGETK